jgi:GNAT superfamily N-acetyltransferase
LAQTVERWRSFAGDINVAETLDGRVLVGFVAFDSREVHALYVDPDHQHMGIGRGLLQSTAEASELWVLEADTSGRTFYERQGWVADGNSRICDGVTEVRYRRANR